MGSDQDEMMRTPGHYFSRITRGLTRVGDSRLRPLGFATAQLPVLSVLKDVARMSQGELARLIRVEQPTMAQLLARMERDGLIRREPDPSDRRSSLVSLTEKALAKLPAGREVLIRGNRDATSGLSADEVEALIGLLRRVLENVEAMDAERPVTP